MEAKSKKSSQSRITVNSGIANKAKEYEDQILPDSVNTNIEGIRNTQNASEL